MFNIQRAVECLLCVSEKIITEFAIIAEKISIKIKIFNVDLWLFSFSSFSFSFALINLSNTERDMYDYIKGILDYG
jgi:hypothetical protein